MNFPNNERTESLPPQHPLSQSFTVMPDGANGDNNLIESEIPCIKRTSTNQAAETLNEKLREFAFRRTKEGEALKDKEKILESIHTSSSSSLSTGQNSPHSPRPQRRFSIGDQPVLPSLLNAQLNNINLFDFDDEDAPKKPGFGDNNSRTKVCLEHKLSTLSTALMTKRQLGKILSGIRDIESTLNHVNIRSKITHIMIVTKLWDPEPIKWASIVAGFLLGYNKDISVFIQDELKNDESFNYNDIMQKHPDLKDRVRFWNADRCRYRPELFDLVLTFGGDGTVLFASWLFQTIVPPVLSFSLGSLGFLTDFDVAEYKETMTALIETGYQCSIRMRFECTVMKSEKSGGEQDRDLTEEVKKLGVDSDTHSISETYTVFNEVVVDRGPNAQMTSLEVFSDREPLTTADADGLIISTPSGSTAYSLSAGGSLVHPEIPGILISPICPHTLSFRPLVIPESIILRLGVPYDSRSTAWCSFDGKNRVELRRGDFITITASRFPIPCIKKPGSKNAWFDRLSSKLYWNERKHQKPYQSKGVYSDFTP